MSDNRKHGMIKLNSCIFFLLVTVTQLNAQNGILDPSFGTGGVSIIDFDNSDNTSKSIVIQPDGKIVVAGYSTTSINLFSVARLNPDGSPDNSFGTGGFVNTALASSSIASSVALQTDGKIIAGGHTWGGSYNEFTLIRYNSDGSPDVTFGNSGVVVTSFSDKSGIGKSVAIQNDGKIILAGFSYSDFSDFDDFALARYNTDGSIDSTFGVDGLVFTSFGFTQDWINAVKIQPDGKIIAGGFSADKMALARYLANGSLDNTFGTGGLVTNYISPGSQAGISGITLTTDAIYACGYSIDAFSNSTLVKYNYDGDLDPDFDGDGILISNIAPQQDSYKDIKIKGDKIVVGGTANIAGLPHFTLSQFDLSGNPVLSFGTDGVFMAAPTNSYNQLEAIDIQNDGKILATGFCQNHPYDIGIIRVISTTLLSADGPPAEKATMVYPNPTSGIIHLYGLSKVFIDIKLLDATGKVLTKINSAPGFTQGELKIDLYNYPGGIYFLLVGNNEFHEVHKIVKE